MRWGVGVCVLALVVVPGRVAAHGEGGVHTIVGPAAFVLGVVLVGIAVVADARDAVSPGLADAGVGAGVVSALLGLVVYYVL